MAAKEQLSCTLFNFIQFKRFTFSYAIVVTFGWRMAYWMVK